MQIKESTYAIFGTYQWGLAALFHPVTDVVYQGLVRLFYQNRTFDYERPGVLSSHLDGFAIEVTSFDIAHTLGCPHECPSEEIRQDGTPPSPLVMVAPLPASPLS
jgi:hypothetical protein